VWGGRRAGGNCKRAAGQPLLLIIKQLIMNGSYYSYGSDWYHRAGRRSCHILREVKHTYRHHRFKSKTIKCIMFLHFVWTGVCLGCPYLISVYYYLRENCTQGTIWTVLAQRVLGFRL